MKRVGIIVLLMAAIAFVGCEKESVSPDCEQCSGGTDTLIVSDTLIVHDTINVGTSDTIVIHDTVIVQSNQAPPVFGEWEMWQWESYNQDGSLNSTNPCSYKVFVSTVSYKIDYSLNGNWDDVYGCTVASDQSYIEIDYGSEQSLEVIEYNEVTGGLDFVWAKSDGSKVIHRYRKF